MDAGWTYGSLVPPATPPEPASVADGTAAQVLDEAEDFLNSIGNQVMAEVQAEQQRPRGFRRLFRRDDR
jgi:predicted thioredoxin/glutaredoxin